ncbi:MAG: polysaccharide biosynthesis/export family protein [Bryobacteraceae bacterium]
MLAALLVLLFQPAAAQLVIGPDDVLDIQVFQVPDLSRTVRVDQRGRITLPLIGVVEAQGLTPGSLEQTIARRLEEKYLNQASVTVFVRELKSRSVSVLGAVGAAGVYQLTGPKTLAEVIALARGLAEAPHAKAGNRVLITHEGKTEEVSVQELMNNQGRAAEVRIHPGDEVRVLPAEVVYVMGDVVRPGSYPVETHEAVNVVQAMALAGGPLRTAKMKEIVIYRKDRQGKTVEVPLTITSRLTGPDAMRLVEPNDILFVPGSMTKRVFTRLLETGITTASGVLIFR